MLYYESAEKGVYAEQPVFVKKSMSSQSTESSLRESPAEAAESAPQDNSSSRTTSHDASVNCRCGCVPNIMSLFQMAELRAKRRKEKAAAEAPEKEKFLEKQEELSS